MTTIGKKIKSPYAISQDIFDNLGNKLFNATIENDVKINDQPASDLIGRATTRKKVTTFQSILDFLTTVENEISQKIPPEPTSDDPDYNELQNKRHQDITLFNDKRRPDIESQFETMIKNAIYHRNITLDERNHLKDIMSDIMTPFRRSELSANANNDLIVSIEYADELVKHSNHMMKLHKTKHAKEINDQLKRIASKLKQQLKAQTRNKKLALTKEELDDIDETLDDLREDINKSVGISTNESGTVELLADVEERYIEANSELDAILSEIEDDQELQNLLRSDPVANREYTQYTNVITTIQNKLSKKMTNEEWVVTRQDLDKLNELINEYQENIDKFDVWRQRNIIKAKKLLEKQSMRPIAPQTRQREQILPVEEPDLNASRRQIFYPAIVPRTQTRQRTRLPIFPSKMMQEEEEVSQPTTQRRPSRYVPPKLPKAQDRPVRELEGEGKNKSSKNYHIIKF